VAVLIAAESMRRRSTAYRTLAGHHAAEEREWLLMADSTDERIAHSRNLATRERELMGEDQTSGWADLARRLRKRSNYHGSLRLRYEYAAARPWLTVAPDPPEPE
jgi:hypothetical protein